MKPEPSLLAPAVRSTVAADVDGLYTTLVWVSIVFFILITGFALWCVLKFPRKEGDEKKLSTPTFHSAALEIFWSVGPLLACIVVFHYGAKQYMDHRVAPRDSMEVKVQGKKWAWEFRYPNGKVSPSVLVVPEKKNVKLLMTSVDVIHSFFVPNYRVKQDVLPGRYSTLWFRATSTGEDQVFCTEYCGDSHSNMLAMVKVKTEAEFTKWLNADPYKGMTLSQIGESVYTKSACVTCHTKDGAKLVGPSFKGLWGRKEVMADGSTITVDEAYIKESILAPKAKIVKGYKPVMPPYKGSLNDKQIKGIVAYLKTLK